MNGIIRVAVLGGNAATDDPKDLLFYSPHNTLKVFIDQKDTYEADTINIPHGLTYMPLFMAFAKMTDAGSFPGTPYTDQWYPVPGLGGGSVPIGSNIHVDATNVVVENPNLIQEVIRTFVFIDRLT